MTPAELRAHLQVAATGGDALARRLGSGCWPAAADGDGGLARRWLARWRPKAAPVRLPRCTCASGRCGVCG